VPFILLPTLDPQWRAGQGGARRDLLEAVVTQGILSGKDERLIQAV